MSCSARSRTCACTPPGMSHEYGQTMPMRMPGQAALAGRGGRSANHSFCSMCQSAGWAAMPCSKQRAMAWVSAGT